MNEKGICYCKIDKIDYLNIYHHIQYEEFKIYRWDFKKINKYYIVTNYNMKIFKNDLDIYSNIRRDKPTFYMEEQFNLFFNKLNIRKLKLFNNNLWTPKNDCEFKIYNSLIL